MKMQESASSPHNVEPSAQTDAQSGSRRLERTRSADVPSERRAPAPPVAAPASVPAPRRARRPFAVLGAILLVVLSVVGGYVFITRNQVTTDDAFVDADIVPVGARVSGQVRR